MQLQNTTSHGVRCELRAASREGARAQRTSKHAACSMQYANHEPANRCAQIIAPTQTRFLILTAQYQRTTRMRIGNKSKRRGIRCQRAVQNALN